MSLLPTCSILEQNDSLGLVFTDTTGLYSGSNLTGWGSPNIATTAIGAFNPSTGHSLELQLTKTTIDTTVVYDYIDLYTVFGSSYFTDNTKLVFTIPHTLLKVNGIVESGITTNSPIEDAIWVITYIVDRDKIASNFSTVTLFTYNQVKVKVYDKLRQISPIYMSYDNRSKEISDTLLLYSLIKGMEASAYVALEQELLNTLDTCEKILVNGSNYTWQ